MEGSPSPIINDFLSSVGLAMMAAGSQDNSASETTSMSHSSAGLLPNGKKTKGRVKIKMEYIQNKLRRYTTFSKRKTGIMKKAYELSTLTGTQVMLLVASETGHVYTFATKKLTPMISSDAGKNLIQQCLSQPDDPDNNVSPNRSEFTFDAAGASGTRKRRAGAPANAAGPNCDTDTSIASFLPTMMSTPLMNLHPYTDEDYQEDVSDDVSEAEDGGDDSKSEEQLAEDENKKDISPTTLQQTIKEALKDAANTRASIAAAKKRKMNVPIHQSHQPIIPSSLLGPFLMTALASVSSPEDQSRDSVEQSRDSKKGVKDAQGRSVIFSGPQGVVYAPDDAANDDDGGAAASALLAGAKNEESQRLLSAFPFNFNLQQLLETAALQAAKAE
ncbi:hypothetical protein PFISCL1PPCAC_2923 [Pristionchus fissidentatus]|uniref:Serum response factor homolog n=1 Tax=Pristionchus fissidentatus TaxID=1538716 RepID=A0AAV5UWK8_9BILA|nr:hypothetical protein PFISCL1PPCAC_2923 [Pristionchus fissidentatus]